MCTKLSAYEASIHCSVTGKVVSHHEPLCTGLKQYVKFKIKLFLINTLCKIKHSDHQPINKENYTLISNSSKLYFIYPNLRYYSFSNIPQVIRNKMMRSYLVRDLLCKTVLVGEQCLVADHADKSK